MQWVFIFMVIAIVGTAGYGFYIWQAVSKSIEISKPLIKEAKAYEQQTSSSSKRILVAGDSTGVGVGAKDPKTSIAGRIGSIFTDANIINISVSGAKLADLEKKLQSVEGTGSFTFILLQIGANDITGHTTYDEVRATLGQILTQTDKLSTKVLVMTAGDVGLTPAFKWPLSSYITHRTKEIRKIFIEEVAKHPNATYVDLFKKRRDEIFNTDIPRYYAPDHFHPSGDGYGVWFEKLRLVL